MDVASKIMPLIQEPVRGTRIRSRIHQQLPGQPDMRRCQLGRGDGSVGDNRLPKVESSLQSDADRCLGYHLGEVMLLLNSNQVTLRLFLDSMT